MRKLCLSRAAVLAAVAVVLAVLCAPPAARAQAEARPQPPGGAAEDGKSPESLVRALYESISGPAGSKHDWSRFRALFLEGARIVAVIGDPGGKEAARPQTVEEFIALAGPNLERHGFEEHEIGRREERYGDIAHVWSAYEARHGSGAEAIVMRGVNSLQLAFDSGRWWIVDILWTGDRSAGPVPEEYLRPATGGQGPP